MGSPLLDLPLRTTPGGRGTGWGGAAVCLGGGRGALVSRSQKGAGHHPEHEPDPELEQEDGVPDVNRFREDIEKYREECRAAIMGLHMFKEKREIDNYVKEIRSSKVDILNVNANELALAVCENAQSALDLAPKVMVNAGLLAPSEKIQDNAIAAGIDATSATIQDIGGVDLDRTEISQHTANQMVRICTTIFCKAAKDAYHKKVEMDTILSFLGSFLFLVRMWRDIYYLTHLDGWQLLIKSYPGEVIKPGERMLEIIRSTKGAAEDQKRQKKLCRIKLCARRYLIDIQ